MKSFTKKYILGEMSVKRVITSLLTVGGVVYLILLVWAMIGADVLLFKPQPSSYKESMFFTTIVSEAGDTIAIEYRKKDTAACTILLSHGNAEDIGDISFITGAFQRAGYNCISYDYPGYGITPGEPTEEGCYRTIEAVYDYLTKVEKISPQKIILLGRSMGGGPSCYLAEKRPIGGLILESSFTSAQRVILGRKILPIDYFDNLARIKKVTSPLLVIHGTDDEVVPFAHGKALYEAANKPRFSLYLEGAKHNDIMVTGGEEYWGNIAGFTAFTQLDTLPGR